MRLVDRASRGRNAARFESLELFTVWSLLCRRSLDQDRIDEAVPWVSPEALSFGVNELACRAVIALARDRDESPSVVARTLLGPPAH
ncbi:hypothetical protein [Streptomyces sp. NPDC052036]|uniref:hypothetical protein n=1 Tax=Streptomyces sp. NPDC052036 TaxID=3155171 RepID=UPI003430FB0C